MRDEQAWLDRRYYGGDLPAEAERALHAAGLLWEDEAATEAEIRRAHAMAPGHFATELAAYKFYMYRHRIAEALPHAEARVAEALRRNGLPADWRAVTADQADFAGLDPEPRLLLFALKSNAYVLARLGRMADAHEALFKLEELDTGNKVGWRALRTVLLAQDQEEPV